MFLASALENINVVDAGIVALLGYAVVFFGLILLMGVITIMGKAFVAAEQKAAQKREKANKRNNRKDEDAPVMSTPIEKTTLGDIEELAALKEKLSGK